jgi:hypothetical protein
MPSPSGRRKYGERIGKLSPLYSLYTHPSPLQVLLGLSRDFYTETGGAGGGQAVSSELEFLNNLWRLGTE